jgi:AraC-like DNA-binding protein
VLQQLDADLGVARSLVTARARLHQVIGDHAPVRTAAACAQLAPETFTRLFTAAYGIAPKQYCQRARLFDAAILLFSGTGVLDAALRAGFNDLTRFYVQFRRLLGATPGDYVRIRNRQDAATAVS